MTKTVVIHQPDFIPYLGFFERFLHADLYLVLDHVQFVNGSARAWTHRDKIKTPQGERWLSISVKKAPRDTPINQVLLSTEVNWREDNLRLLERNYRESAYFEEIMPAVESLFSRPDTRLVDFTLYSIEMLADMLDVRVPMVLSSTLQPQGAKNELLIDLLRKVDATHYLSGVGARAYLDPAPFAAAGIDVVWQDFVHPVYPQLHGDFVPFLSSLDMLFNCGIEHSRELLRGTK
jgi:hypothetical protein